jgi:hypothetical protein
MQENMKYYYKEIKQRLDYRLGLTVINACFSSSGTSLLTAINGISGGHSGVLDPTNTNLFGTCGIIWLEDKIKPGDQRTNGG